MESLIQATSGGLGTAISKLVIYPLDLMQTRLTVGDSSQTSRDVYDELTAKHGFVGLYRGVGPKLVKSVTGKFCYFFIYAALLKRHKQMHPGKHVPTFVNLAIGYFSEVLELPLIMPLDAIVSKVQACKENKPVSAIIADMVSNGGWRSFFASFDCYLMSAFQPAIQFTLFDQMKDAVLESKLAPGVPIEDLSLSSLEAFLLGAFAYAISGLVTHPVLVVRTMVQAKGKASKRDAPDNNTPVETKEETHFPAMATRIVRRDGLAGLYRGLGPQLLQGVIASALMLALKEKINGFSKLIVLMYLKKVRARAR